MWLPGINELEDAEEENKQEAKEDEQKLQRLRNRSLLSFPAPPKPSASGVDATKIDKLSADRSITGASRLRGAVLAQHIDQYAQRTRNFRKRFRRRVDPEGGASCLQGGRGARQLRRLRLVSADGSTLVSRLLSYANGDGGDDVQMEPDRTPRRSSSTPRPCVCAARVCRACVPF